jgi:hypothetical protein
MAMVRLCAHFEQQQTLNPLYEQQATARSNISEKAPATTMVPRMTSQKLYVLGALLRTLRAANTQPNV